MSRRRAVVIGNSLFDHDRWHPLPACEHDAQGMRYLLTDRDLCGFTVDDEHYLLNEPSARVLPAIERILSNAVADDEILLYVSGHADRRASREGPALYFPLRDTDPAALESTAVTASLLGRWLRASPAASIVLIVDSCYAGGLGIGLSGAKSADIDLGLELELSRGTDKGVSAEHVSVLAGSGPGEIADSLDPRLDRTVEGMSPYTRFVVQGIRSGHAIAEDGRVTDSSLHEYLTATMRDGGFRQTPHLHNARQATIAFAQTVPIPPPTSGTSEVFLGDVHCPDCHPVSAMLADDAHRHSDHLRRAAVDDTLDAALEGSETTYVIAIGSPLSGRKRALLQAIVRRWPAAMVHTVADFEGVRRIREGRLPCLRARGGESSQVVVWVPEADRFCAPGLLDDDCLERLRSRQGTILAGTMTKEAHRVLTTRPGLLMDAFHDLTRSTLFVEVPDRLSPDEFVQSRRIWPTFGSALGAELGDGAGIRRRLAAAPSKEARLLVRCVAQWQALGGPRPLTQAEAQDLCTSMLRREDPDHQRDISSTFHDAITWATRRTETRAQLLTSAAPRRRSSTDAYGLVAHPLVVALALEDFGGGPDRNAFEQFDIVLQHQDRCAMAFRAHLLGFDGLAYEWWRKSWEDGNVEAARASAHLAAADGGPEETIPALDAPEPDRRSAFAGTSLAILEHLASGVASWRSTKTLAADQVSRLEEIVATRRTHWWPLAAQLLLALDEVPATSFRVTGHGEIEPSIPPARLALESLRSEIRFDSATLAAYRAAVITEADHRTGQSTGWPWQAAKTLLAQPGPFRLDVAVRTAVEMAAIRPQRAIRFLCTMEGLLEEQNSQDFSPARLSSRAEEMIRDIWPQPSTSAAELTFLREYLCGTIDSHRHSAPEFDGVRIAALVAQHGSEDWAREHALWLTAQSPTLDNGHRSALERIISSDPGPGFAVPAVLLLTRCALDETLPAQRYASLVALVKQTLSTPDTSLRQQELLIVEEVRLLQRLTELAAAQGEEAEAKRTGDRAVSTLNDLITGQDRTDAARHRDLSVRLQMTLAATRPVRITGGAIPALLRLLTMTWPPRSQADYSMMPEVRQHVDEQLVRIAEKLASQPLHTREQFLVSSDLGKLCAHLIRTGQSNWIRAAHTLMTATLTGSRHASHATAGSTWLPAAARGLSEHLDLAGRNRFALAIQATAQHLTPRLAVECFRAASQLMTTQARTSELSAEDRADQLRGAAVCLMDASSHLVSWGSDASADTIEKEFAAVLRLADGFGAHMYLPPLKLLALGENWAIRGGRAFWLMQAERFGPPGMDDYMFRLGLGYVRSHRLTDATRVLKDLKQSGQKEYRAAAAEWLGWRGEVDAQSTGPANVDVDTWLSVREDQLLLYVLITNAMLVAVLIMFFISLSAVMIPDVAYQAVGAWLPVTTGSLILLVIARAIVRRSSLRARLRTSVVIGSLIAVTVIPVALIGLKYVALLAAGTFAAFLKLFYDAVDE